MMNLNQLDAVFVLTCTRLINRLPMIKSEVARVGLKDKLHVITQFQNPFDSLIRSQVPHIGELNVNSRMSLWLGHYRMLKTGYELGFNNVLFLEDDIRFLKDVTQINAALEELPTNYGVALWDCACDFPIHYRNGLANGKALNLSRWGCTAGGVPLTSAGAYMLDRNGMRELIGLYESVTIKSCEFRMARCTDHYWPSLARKLNRKLFFAVPNLAIQADLRSDPRIKGMYLGGYRSPRSPMKINLSNYAADILTPSTDTKESLPVAQEPVATKEDKVVKWTNKISMLSKLNTCKNIIVLANHNRVNYTPDQLNKTLEKYNPEESCLVLLNHAGPWKNISNDLRKRFCVVLWIRRYHATDNRYQGQDDYINEDNVIELCLHGDGRVPRENMVVEVPGSRQAVAAAKAQLQACKISGNPTCGMLVSSFLHDNFPASKIILQGFDDNDIDPTVYNTSWHASLKEEHRVLREHYGCELTPIVSNLQG